MSIQTINKHRCGCDTGDVVYEDVTPKGHVTKTFTEIPVVGRVNTATNGGDDTLSLRDMFAIGMWRVAYEETRVYANNETRHHRHAAREAYMIADAFLEARDAVVDKGFGV